MHQHYILAAGALTALLATSTSSRAQSKAEFDALKKKVAALEERLGERESAPTTAEKLKLSESLTELKLYGDLRLRYQYDNKGNQVDPPGEGSDRDRSASSNQRSRYRFRLR